ncbi:hypothetical protein OG304_04570 [Streptomyces sp. NBC_00160]|uniref:hypothetical protein n=1 Tax=Streptomyces sp. NBC_00160 TaxID=2903628 RepID=UPI0022551229|nr:hypothetical protein [Streptomyces sp. NBC_00160]MCX5302726.1 hypothetical protein [Streptomyces sp. NBC_00160]
MKEQRRATAWCGRLLLCAALLLGIVTMHSLGHPAENGSSHLPGNAVMAAALSSVEHAMGPTASVEHQRHAPDPLGGMDTLSVCLAVLSVWAIALLTVGPLFQRTAAFAASALAHLPHAMWPMPPPRSARTRLAQLSLMRI